MWKVTRKKPEWSNCYTLNTVTITRCMVRPAYTAVNRDRVYTNWQDPTDIPRDAACLHLVETCTGTKITSILTSHWRFHFKPQLSNHVSIPSPRVPEKINSYHRPSCNNDFHFQIIPAYLLFNIRLKNLCCKLMNKQKLVHIMNIISYFTKAAVTGSAKLTFQSTQSQISRFTVHTCKNPTSIPFIPVALPWYLFRFSGIPYRNPAGFLSSPRPCRFLVPRKLERKN